MKKRFVNIFVLVLLALGLMACTNKSVQSSVSETETQSTSTDMYNTGQLIQGSFMLEDTEFAVNADQAAQLLPLWKAYKAISADSTSSTVEQEALVKQIMETMTNEQLNYITSNPLKPEDVAALMEKLGIDNSMGTNRGNWQGNNQNGDDSQFTPPDGAQAPGDGTGGLPGGGMGGGNRMGDGTGTTQLDPEQLATLQAEREANGVGFRGNPTDTLLLDPLIELLTSKIQ